MSKPLKVLSRWTLVSIRVSAERGPYALLEMTQVRGRRNALCVRIKRVWLDKTGRARLAAAVNAAVNKNRWSIRALYAGLIGYNAHRVRYEDLASEVARSEEVLSGVAYVS